MSVKINIKPSKKVKIVLIKPNTLSVRSFSESFIIMYGEKDKKQWPAGDRHKNLTGTMQAV